MYVCVCNCKNHHLWSSSSCSFEAIEKDLFIAQSLNCRTCAMVVDQEDVFVSFETFYIWIVSLKCSSVINWDLIIKRVPNSHLHKWNSFTFAMCFLFVSFLLKASVNSLTTKQNVYLSSEMALFHVNVSHWLKMTSRPNQANIYLFQIYNHTICFALDRKLGCILNGLIFLHRRIDVILHVSSNSNPKYIDTPNRGINEVFQNKAYRYQH